MNRKFNYCFRVIFNLLRNFILRVTSFNSINCAVVEFISPFADINVSDGGKIKIGSKSNIEKNSQIRSSGGEIVLGDGVYINRNCNIISHEKIAIGNGVTIGPNVCIYDHDHNYKHGGGSSYISKKITIGDGVWIGANCIITKGVSIGANSVIAAGTIVTKNVEKDTIIRSRITYAVSNIKEFVESK